MANIVNFLTGDTVDFAQTVGTWTVTTGSASLQVSREQEPWENARALKVTKTSSTGSIAVTSGTFSVGTDYLNTPYKASVWVWSPTDSSASVTLSVTNGSNTVATNSSLFSLRALHWTLVYVTYTPPDNDSLNTVSMRISLGSMTSGSSVFISHPAVIAPDAVFFNEFAGEVWLRLPQYMQDADIVESDPDYPLYRFIDVLTFAAYIVYAIWSQILYIPPDEGAEKKSYLVDPDLARVEWLPWLLQFVGGGFTQAVQSPYSAWGTISDIIDIDGDGAEWSEWQAEADWGAIQALSPAPGDTDSLLRWQISSAAFGLRAGTTESIKSAMQQRLTGTKAVTVVPVNSGPWNIGVEVLASEAEDSEAELEAFLESAIPAGFSVTVTKA